MPAIPELRRLGAGEFQFKAKMDYITRCYIKLNEQQINKIKIRQVKNKTEKRKG